MELKLLSKAELKALYENEMKHAFPPSELKPLKAMEQLRDGGRYDPLGLFNGEELLGYALLWLEPDVPFALLDYLGTVQGKRGTGLGGRLLELLGERYAHYRGIFGEAEGVTSADPDEAALQRRRLAFYYRNGFRYGGYDCALYGVHYQTLIRGGDDVTAQELMQAHQAIYKSGFAPHLYKQFIQIPLREGEETRPVVTWTEE